MASGARSINWRFASFPSHFDRSVSSLSSSFFNRASSASRSIKEPSGTITFSVSTSAVAHSGVVSSGVLTARGSVRANSLIKSWYCSMREVSAESSLCSRTGMRFRGSISISPRIFRTADTTALTQSRSATASWFSRKASVAGKGCVMMVGPVRPVRGVIRCHNASVINGINGCNSRSAVSKTDKRVCRTAWARSSLGSLARRILAISRYQLQYSSHTKLCSV